MSGSVRRNDSVAVRAKGGRDDLGHSDSCLCRHQCRQGLVLDLLQTSVRDAPRRIAVGERAPAPGQALGVLRIATEHAYLQRPPARVVSDVLCRAHVLLLRRLEIGHHDPEGGQRVANALSWWDSGGGAEHQPHQGADPDT